MYDWFYLVKISRLIDYIEDQRKYILILKKLMENLEWLFTLFNVGHLFEHLKEVSKFQRLSSKWHGVPVWLLTLWSHPVHVNNLILSTNMLKLGQNCHSLSIFQNLHPRVRESIERKRKLSKHGEMLHIGVWFI